MRHTRYFLYAVFEFFTLRASRFAAAYYALRHAAC